MAFNIELLRNILKQRTEKEAARRQRRALVGAAVLLGAGVGKADVAQKACCCSLALRVEMFLKRKRTNK